jgi:hypothetical protein
VTVAVAVVGGFITGKLMNCMSSATGQAEYNNWYDDSQYWEVEEGEVGQVHGDHEAKPARPAQSAIAPVNEARESDIA